MNKEHQQLIKTVLFKNGSYCAAAARWCHKDLSWLSQYEGDSISEKAWNVLHTRPRCHCGNLTRYINFGEGYRSVCSRKCSQALLATSKSARHSRLWTDKDWSAATSKGMKETHFKNRADEKLAKLKKKNIVPLDDLTPGFDNEYRWQHSCGEVFVRSFKRVQGIYCPQCHVSRGQGELFEFIREHYNGEIRVNDREQIAPLEIDIFLPETSLGFEFNGKYWHTSGGLREEQKTFEATEAGIKLIHVWEVQWNKNREQIQAEVLSALRA